MQPRRKGGGEEGVCAAPQEHGIDLMTDPLARTRLMDAAESLRIELATRVTSSVNLPFISADARGPKHLRTAWTRSRYEQVLQPVWDALEQLVRDAAQRAGPVERVVVVGGLARMPRVLAAVERATAAAPATSSAPEELAVTGATVAGVRAALAHKRG